jgi:hypothetical protein
MRDKKTKIYCGILITGALFAPVVAWAQLEITEIMYDVSGTDTGREWIEVRNTGEVDEDLTTWKLFEANTAHKITAVGGATLASGVFAIIADVPDKFLADHPGFSGLIFDSVFSLSNSGETIALRDSMAVDLDTLVYDPAWGASGDEFSLQKTADGRWVAAVPTIAAATVATQSEVPPAAEEVVTSSTPTPASSAVENIAYAAYASQSIVNTDPDTIDLQVSSGRDRLGFTGIPLQFKAKIKKALGATSTLEHAWSMGDGVLQYGQTIWHTYVFAGDYSVILNSRTKQAEAVSKVRVRIIDPELSIPVATPEYIDIRNAGTYEVNLGEMILMTGQKRFFLPPDTIVDSQKTIHLPASVTHFYDIDAGVLLVTPTRKVVAEYRPHPEPLISLPVGMTADGLRERLIHALNTNMI